MPWVFASAALFLLACLLAWRFVFRGEALERWSRPAVLGTWGALLLLGLALRVALALAVHGVPTDIACFKSWAMTAAEGGLSRFYSGTQFVDYPPGYVYVLGAVGLVRLALGLDHGAPGFLLLVKLPSILLDLVAAGLVFRLARPQTSLARAATLSALVALNPAAIHNSAVYGQVDVFLAVPLVLALALVARGALVRAALVYTVAVLVKPQALLVAPIAVLALLRKRDVGTAARAVAASAAAAVVLLFPFSRSLDPSWVIGLYARTLGSYPYATLNAANLHALVGGNWAPLSDRLFIVSHGTFGAAALAAVVLGAAWLYHRSRDPASVLPVALVVLSAAFLVAARMHERYLYPAVLVAAAAYAVWRDPRFLLLFAGFSVSVLLNEALLHDLVARTGSFFVPANDVLLRLLAALNAVLVAYAIHVAIDLRASRPGDRREPAAPEPRPSTPPEPSGAPPEPAPPLARRDWMLLAGLTLAYGAVAFTHLGSLRAPATCWSPSTAGETTYLDLGSVRRLGRIVYFVGVGQGGFTLGLSADGRTWTWKSALEQGPYDKVEWRVLSAPGAAARWLRLTAERPGATLCEVAAFERGAQVPSPISPAPPPDAADAAGGAPGAGIALTDEQGLAPRNPSFLDGMYFDEVYHARTAYEMLHGLEPSETTHPPLGKGIIALGIALFGMTPFGWRFSGTLLGVAMVPLLYLFALRLFRRPGLAFLAAFLLAFDFMHFVQTRAGTIDVYGVFFVILAYHFMHEFLRRDFWGSKMGELLRPLFLSGLAFGLGVASKWSVLYGGAGLALILFTALVLRGREWRRGDRDAFPRRALAVLGGGAVFFVLVPAAVYVLAYVPFMRIPAPGHGLREVLASQGHMYRYHAELAQTHPFASPWWQWPLMLRPVWYYQGLHGLRAGWVSSIVAMGNPAVWWPGILAVAAGLWLAVRRRDAAIAFVLVGLFSQLVPWAIAPRKLVFIYHFFPSVPFLILAIVYLAKELVDRRPWLVNLVRAYGALVLGLFALFYPILSGLPVHRSFVLGWLRWLDSWIFC